MLIGLGASVVAPPLIADGLRRLPFRLLYPSLMISRKGQDCVIGILLGQSVAERRGGGCHLGGMPVCWWLFFCQSAAAVAIRTSAAHGSAGILFSVSFFFPPAILKILGKTENSFSIFPHFSVENRFPGSLAIGQKWTYPHCSTLFDSKTGFFRLNKKVEHPVNRKDTVTLVLKASLFPYWKPVYL